MIKSVNYTYEDIDVELDEIDEMIDKVYEEACEMLKNRWVWMDSKKVIYDNEVVACIPNTQYHDCVIDGTENQTKDYFFNKYKELFNIENMKWDFMTYKENVKMINSSINYPLKCSSYGIYYDRAKKNYNIIAYENSDGICKGVYINNSNDFNYPPRTIIPIHRLNNKDSNKIENNKVFVLWLDRGFIPVNTKYKEEYEILINLNKEYELNLDNNPRVDRDKIKSDNENNSLKINLEIETDKLIEKLLNTDKQRADIDKYDEKILTDPNRGHWDILLEPTDTKKLKVELNQEIVYRNPLKDIKEGGIVGIDFGTKSTIIVHQENTTDISPMRIGTGNLKKSVESNQYENPTVMEFINIENFMKLYNREKGRPSTKWMDLTVSHIAFDSMVNSNSEHYDSYFSELKQWASNKDKRIRIKDKNNETYDLPAFIEIEEDELNPIEIYAYYLGLYINNMRNGIYLNYILSFPVTYEKEIREKIISSFEKGIKKSLPPEILKHETVMEKFSVLVGASEPAAYAISALKGYEFDPEDDEKIYYGVFDFGGGTTDFDFGIFREANQRREDRYDYVIEHFGSGGDRYLGGENVLELIAYEVFKKNADKLREEGIRFILPPECKKFAGSESLLDQSQEARLNTRQLMEKLRCVWEKHENYKNQFNSNTVGLNLYTSSGEIKTNFQLNINIDELEKTIEERIEKGVRNFFESIKLAFDENTLKDNQINIFLAGNSSKSSVVRDLFEKYINGSDETEKDLVEGEVVQTKNDSFIVFPPLGTTQAYNIQKSMGIEVNEDDIEKPTGKTGVAFGLVEGREGGSIKVVNKNNDENNEAKFRYYVGRNKKRQLRPILTPEIVYNNWSEFIDASEQFFEIYYTTLPEASSNKLDISQTTKSSYKLLETFEDEDVSVYIRAVSPSEIEYVVGKLNGENLDELSQVVRVQLN